MARNYSSTAVATTLTAGINNSVTSIAVAATTGFPVSYPYTLIIDPDLATEEVVTVTAGGGLNLTVTRGSDGTSAQSHSLGAVVKHGVSARDFSEPQQHIDNTTNPHGLTIGNLVTLTGTQTLTNKTLTAPVISTISNTGTLTLPTSTDTLVGRATVDTLTNKTLTSPTVNSPTVTSGTLDAASTIGGVSGTSLSADRTAWTSWTPTYTSITSGNGYFYYKLIGKTLYLRGRFLLGNTVGGAEISPPGGVSFPTPVAFIQMLSCFASGLPYTNLALSCENSTIKFPSAFSGALGGISFNGVVEVS